MCVIIICSNPTGGPMLHLVLSLLITLAFSACLPNIGPFSLKLIPPSSFLFSPGKKRKCQSAKLCNMQSCGGSQQCLFLPSLPAAGHLCGHGEPAGHVPGHLRAAAPFCGVLLQAASVRQDGNQTRGQCQIQPGRK